jgi:hypothetical protein
MTGAMVRQVHVIEDRSRQADKPALFVAAR